MHRIGVVHEAFLKHPEYEAGIDELLDLSQSSMSNLTKPEFEIIRQTMLLEPTRHHCKSVIVVNTGLEYGLGRMLGARLDRDVPVERHMSYDIDEGLNWLRPGEAEELKAVHQRRVEALSQGT